MIKNDRQYNIARARADRLRSLQDALLERLQATTNGERLRAELELSATSAEVARLAAELDDFDALRAGRVDVGTVTTLSDLPRVLVRARIAAGWSQAALAERLGLKEQQIQRYEATDYESANLGRLRSVADALSVRLAGDLNEVPGDLRRRDWSKALEQAGLPRDLVEHRMVTAAELESDDDFVTGVAARVARVFGWLPRQVLDGDVAIGDSAMALAAFKKPTSANEMRVAALAGYARYLLLRTIEVVPRSVEVLPADPFAFRARVLRDYERFDLTGVLQALWDLGLPVLPLSDPGGFHAAYWRQGGRGGIVLKQGNRLESRWLFDLLHEVGHAADLADQGDLAVVEEEVEHGDGDDREMRANQYAGLALLGADPELLVDEVWGLAGGRLGLISRAVGMVARRRNLPKAVLGFQVAHRLSRRGHNWWGSATKLAVSERDGWGTTRDVFVSRLDWSGLEAADRELLALALQDRRPTVVSTEA